MAARPQYDIGDLVYRSADLFNDGGILGPAVSCRPGELRQERA